MPRMDGVQATKAIRALPGDVGRVPIVALTANADPADARTDTIVGDVMIAGKADANWGLHLIDMNLAMGDLVDIVHQQAVAWKKSH